MTFFRSVLTALSLRIRRLFSVQWSSGGPLKLAAVGIALAVTGCECAFAMSRGLVLSVLHAMALRGKNYPWFERCLRPVPDELVPDGVSPGVVAEMAALGYGHADSAQPSLAPRTAPLLARFDATVELVHALRERDTARVQGLLKLGAMESGRFFSCGKNPENPYEDWLGADALGLAAILDSRAGNVHLMPLFEGYTDFQAAHSNFGENLLHLADSPGVCTWLLARVLSPDATDATDDDDELPDEKLSPEAHAVIERWRLNRSLPAASGEPVGRSRL